MTSFEPVQAGPYLTPSDPPDLAGISKLIVDWAALRSNMRFASTAARDAAIPSPVEGMVSWLNDTNRLYVHNGTAWVLLSALDDTGWIAPALGSGWSVYNGETIGYRRLNGVTYLRGRGSSTGTSGTAFTLPVEFRNGQIMIVLAPDAGGAATRSNILTTGAVSQAVLAAVTGWSFAAFTPFPADA